MRIVAVISQSEWPLFLLCCWSWSINERWPRDNLWLPLWEIVKFKIISCCCWDRECCNYIYFLLCVMQWKDEYRIVSWMTCSASPQTARAFYYLCNCITEWIKAEVLPINVCNWYKWKVHEKTKKCNGNKRFLKDRWNYFDQATNDKSFRHSTVCAFANCFGIYCPWYLASKIHIKLWFVCLRYR